jgi:hypothetical protein
MPCGVATAGSVSGEEIRKETTGKKKKRRERSNKVNEVKKGEYRDTYGSCL